MPTAVSRRHLVAATAWSVPVILVGQPASAASCSTAGYTVYTPTLTVSSTVQKKTVNGHTLGTMTFTVRNDGTLSLPTGTVYSVVFEVTQAPGNAAKNVTVTPQGAPSGLSRTPSTPTSMNPDGGSMGVKSFTATLALTSPLGPGESLDQVWDVDSETGIGATHVTMTGTNGGYGSDQCAVTGPGGDSAKGGDWGSSDPD
jgi:hypothetical protein